MTLRLKQISNNQMKLVNLKENELKATPHTPMKIKNEILKIYIDSYFTDNYQTDFFPETLKESETEYEGAKKQ